jgi:EAL and modified HD-GYP domain-containing signal transduction protein
MSLLSRILGRRTPPPPPPPPAAPPPPPPPPPPTDTLALTGAGLDGADLAGPVELTLLIGDRTFTAAATRRGPATTFPAEFALSGFHEVVPEPADEVVAPEPEVVLAPAPEVVAAPTPEVVAAPAPEAVPALEPVAAPEPEVVPAPEVVAAAEPDFVADVQDSREIAVVRRPLTDADGSVVGYELVVDDAREGPAATAGLLLDAFGDIGLERLAGRHPVWVTMTPEFLVEVGTPPVRPDRVVLQLPAASAPDKALTALRRLQFSGYTIAIDGYDEALADVAKLVKIPVAGRTDEELRAAVEAPARRNLQLVATGVATPEEVARCQALGFTVFQGDFFAKPNLTRQRRVGTGGVASLKSLAEVARPDATFEDLEAAISSDVGLSLKLLRYVNSAFFALPRTVESVREALTLLGTATVRRWATVMALASASDAPEELVELALQRARMCEVLGGNRAVDGSDAHFTVGLFSVADALLDSPMEEVLETLPFSEEIRAALLRREGPKGELLTTVVAYEQGEFPAADGDVSLATAYGDAVEYADGAVRAAA